MKKCTICGIEAQYKIKDTSDHYCEECAKEYFADLSLLQKLEEEALALKRIIKEKIENGSYSSELTQENQIRPC